MSTAKILFIEAFYGGSHKQLMDVISDLFPNRSELFTMPAKKWHWRSIASPLHLAQMIPKEHNFSVLFTSSVLPLAELLSLRSDLMRLYKIVYFHENQLVYPVREQKKRYFQHGYNDVLTSLVADKVLFNSNFNKEFFLKHLTTFFNVMPDYRPKNLESQIRPKCEVAYFPVDIFQACHTPDHKSSTQVEKQKDLHIVWPHRWEHDKDPETFFSVMKCLKDAGEPFHLSVIGETFKEKPEIFEEAKECLKDYIINWGYVESREEYYNVLQSADVVVSTALHEFFGVSMLEATILGCYPLCPKRLVYPEIYPEIYLYNTPNQLYKKLKYFCKKPYAARHHKLEVDLKKYSWNTLKMQYMNYFNDRMA